MIWWYFKRAHVFVLNGTLSFVTVVSCFKYVLRHLLAIILNSMCKLVYECCNDSHYLLLILKNVGSVFIVFVQPAKPPLQAVTKYS